MQNRLWFSKDKFMLNDKPFQIISGAIHYFRIMPEAWEDRLIKLKNCGFNTVETYIPWNFHEPEEGQYRFDGIYDVVKFIETAQKLGLYVILRPSPYICAEWDFGGLPYWLLKYDGIRLRCSNKIYLEKVERYYSVLLPKIEPLLGINGGPVIALQVENEYGSYGNDTNYIKSIKKIMEKYLSDCFYFTADGVSDFMLTGGTSEDIFAAVNFGSSSNDRFNMVDTVRPGYPHLCMEYWCGWFEHWGESIHKRETKDILSSVKSMLKNGDSFNIYMFCGGTNFGFYNGANHLGEYQPTATSYDYRALLTENGEITERYLAVQQEISKYYDFERLSLKEYKTKAYGDLKLTQSAPLFNNLDKISEKVCDITPKSFEELGLDYGFVLYRTQIRAKTDKMNLNLIDLHDRAIVYADGKKIGTKERGQNEENRIEIGAESENVALDVFVENMGRINYGYRMSEKKGISGIALWQQLQYGYEMYPIGLKDLSELDFKDEFFSGDTPCFYKACFEVEECYDTFLDMSGFTKGVVIVNGFNLGRYWEIGPYLDVYVPKSILKQGKNEVIVFELEKAKNNLISSKGERTIKEDLR